MRALWILLFVFACGVQPAGPSFVPPPGSSPWPDSARQAVLEALTGEPAPTRTPHRDAAGHPLYTNRLILESSPYLRQHAHNPVDWMPWGDEAFERAKAEGKPVLLSVGYSTCHWCHVMEEESFEDVEIARRINERFVPVKVDREERPDVDATYMKAVQALAGQGGWPMTVVLRPDDRVPIFAATYLPPRAGDRGAKAGLLEVLTDLSERWLSDRTTLDELAVEVSRRMAMLAAPPDPAGAPGLEALGLAVQKMEATFDRRRGGFGRPPKFPRPSELRFLFAEHRRTGAELPRDMALETLDAMAAGGIRDHLGGGFHRYAMDANWSYPHFEKMLYDQGQIATAYLEAWQITGDDRYRAIAKETLDFVLRELRDERGGFHTALDADSDSPEGEREEGRFYTWTPPEVAAAVGKSDAPIALAWYDVGVEGAVEGRTVLSARKTPGRLAGDLELPLPEVEAALPRIRKAMFQARRDRPVPPKDDKVVLAWNALTISALARAGFAMDNPAYLEAARGAARFVTRHMAGNEGALFRTWRAGEVGHPAVLDDYALLAEAMLDLFEATGEGDWLHLATVTAEQMDARFGADGGGWYEIGHDAEAMLVRSMPWSDGDLPSGNSAAVGVHLRLYELTGDEAHRERADAALSRFGVRLERSGPAAPQMLGWLGFRLGRPLQVVVLSAGDAAPMLEVLRTTYQPHKVQVLVPDGMGFTLGDLSLVKEKTALEGKTTVYVCHRGTCEAPTTEPEVLRRQLARSPE